MKGLVVIKEDGKATWNRIKRYVWIPIHAHTNKQDLHLDFFSFILTPIAAFFCNVFLSLMYFASIFLQVSLFNTWL